MNLTRYGTAYGGFTIDIDRVPADGIILDCGVGTDMSFAEGLHEACPGTRWIMVDHTDEAENFVKVVRGYPWAKFIKAAIAPHGIEFVKMHRHRTRSGSESVSRTHAFADASSYYRAPAVSLTTLIAEYRPCVVKLDIESAEYGTIREAIGVPQVCAEFHHRMDGGYAEADTSGVIRDFEAAGYEMAHRTPEDEILFVRRT